MSKDNNAQKELMALIETTTGNLNIEPTRKLKIAQAAAEIRLMVRGGESLDDKQAIALGQFSIMNKLNPTTGECFYANKVGPVIGIEGLRRKSREQYHKETGGGHTYWMDYQHPTTEEFEYKTGDYVSKATVKDPQAIGEWLDKIERLTQLIREGGEKDPFTVAKDIIGPAPEWVGYGKVTKEESKNFSKTERLFSHKERAEKRAEAAALRKRFQIGIDYADEADELFDPIEVEIVDAEVVEVEEIPETEFQYKPAIIKLVLEKSPLKTDFEATELLDKMKHTNTKLKGQVKEWLRIYSNGVDLGLKGDKLIEYANEKMRQGIIDAAGSG